jgi:circadian clock protein KaiC
MRGVAYRGGHHDYVIRTGGLVVFPRMVPSEHRSKVTIEPFPSGLPALDALLGGGLDRGTSTLIVGPAGAGKSSLAALFARLAAERGERGAVFLFDEALETFRTRLRGLGMSIEEHLARGSLTVQQVDPAEVSPGELLTRVRAEVDTHHARVVVIDSVNGLLQAMPDENFVLLQLHELLMYLGQQGVLTILILAQHGVLGESLAGPADVSYLADTVILVRYFEAGGAVRKAMSVVKRRTGGHETSIREYRLTGRGVVIGEPLTAFHGVLTGTPLYGSDVAGGEGKQGP